MKKMGLLKSEKMGSYEKEQGWASYRTIVNQFISDLVLCNNIIDIDSSVYDNMDIQERYFDENDNEITEEEYFKNDNAYCDNSCDEIYQYYLCNLSSYEKEQCENAGLLLSYSDKLDCDVLCVTHYGISWDYVLTNVKLFDTWEELKKYEEGEI